MAKSPSQLFHEALRVERSQLKKQTNTWDESLLGEIQKCDLDGTPLDDVPPKGKPEDEEK
jgi:hypothetical protein